MLPNMKKYVVIRQLDYDGNLNGYYLWRNIGGYYYSWNSDNPIGVYYYDMLNKLRYLI